MSRTVGIIKPDAFQAGDHMNILVDLLAKGFTVVQLRTHTLTDEEARDFYSVHNHQPWFNDLISFMTSGPSCFMVLEYESNAVEAWRETMISLREKYGTSVQCNAVHGSDSNENAEVEEKFVMSL